MKEKITWVAALLTLFCGALMGFANRSYGQCAPLTLRINEVYPLPKSGDWQWVELLNYGGDPVNARGVFVTDEEEHGYMIPPSLPDIPPRAFVLVVFDGKGSDKNDLDFAGDNMAALHTPAGFVNPFAATGDQCALYRGDNRTSRSIQCFVAWGTEPGKEAERAVEAGIWPNKSVFLAILAETSIEGPQALLHQGGSFGLAGSKARPSNLDDWNVYEAGQVTPGAPNPLLAAPQLYVPSNGTQTSEGLFWFGWGPTANAASYQLQVCSDSECTVPIIDVSGITETSYRPANPLAADAVYYWRIRAFDAEKNPGPWSETWKVTVGSPVPPGGGVPKPGPPPENPVAPEEEKSQATFTVSGRVIDSRTNHGLQGAEVSLNGRTTLTNAAGAFTFAGVAPDLYLLTGTLQHYTVALRVIYVSGNLTNQDLAATGDRRVLGVTSLSARKDTTMLCLLGCEEDNTNGNVWDADHLARPTWGPHESWYCWATAARMLNNYRGGDITRDEIVYEVKRDLLHGAAAGATRADGYASLRYALRTDDAHLHITEARPSEEDVVAFIDANRPIRYSTGGHAMVVDGYEYRDRELWARFLNTDNNGTIAFNKWTTEAFAWCAIPETGLAARSTDADIARNSDADGINDFDEKHRFASSETRPDTDGDDVPDKKEIISYTFRTPKPNINVDGDGVRPEADKDSDNGGLEDGEEDTNFNGKMDPKETDPYDPKDDLRLDLIFCIDSTGSMWDDIGAAKAAAAAIVDEVANRTDDYRIAVVDYRDFPVDPYGDPGDYTYRDVLGFSKDKGAIIGAINSLYADGGADWDESVYSALMHCINASSLGGWRGEPIPKQIIHMCDAPPHDPEPFTGYTSASVIAAAAAADPVVISAVIIGRDLEAKTTFEGLAAATGGIVTTAAGAAEVVSALMEVISAIAKSPPVASAGGPYTGAPGVPITLDASATWDPDGCGSPPFDIVLYEWDWDGDGIFDEQTTFPTITHSWPLGFSGEIRLRATDRDCLQAVATASLSMGPTDLSAFTTSLFTDWELNYRTGTLFGTLQITNTSTHKLIRNTFWYVAEPSEFVHLMHPDGTTDEGYDYVDITAQVLAQLPSIGDGDNELDPGETVTITGIEFYSRDRSDPQGFLEGIWGIDPPLTPVHLAIGKVAKSPDGSVQLEWNSIEGATYRVLCTQDMVNWSEAATTQQVVWTDKSADDAARRFYRIEVR